MVTVKFINVGSNNMNWTANISELLPDLLYEEIKNKGALMSNYINFSYDKAAQCGHVFVGRFRKVGEFKVVEEAQK